MQNEYKIELSRDGYEILKVKIDNKWFYIGSKYSMKNEIDKFINKFNEKEDSHSILLVYGFASGVYIEALRQIFKNNRIIVLEPNESLNEYIYNKKWVIEDENLIIQFPKQYESNSEFLNYIEEYDLDKIKFVYLDQYLVYKDDLKKILGDFNKYLSILKVNRNTKLVFSKRWFETTIRNIPSIIKSTPINLYKDIYKDKPAIIVSAGPSLEKNIDELKNIHKNILIMSGGRTLKPLINKGIDLSLLTVTDPGEISYELVEEYIQNVNVPLLFYEGTNEKVVSSHKGDKICFSDSKFIDDIFQMDTIQLSAGGSVSHSMVSCALVFGCNPIIFIGQDLAFNNKNRYSSLTKNRDGKDPSNCRENNNYILVEGVKETQVMSNGEFNNFRASFERIIEGNPETVFINATEGGARIKGTIEMSLKDAILKYGKSEVEDIKKIKYNVNLKENAISLLKKAKKSTENIINISKEALDKLKNIKKLKSLNDINKLNKSLTKLNELDDKIKEEYKNIELVKDLMYPIIYKTLNGRYTNSSDDSQKDKIEGIINENRELYSQFVEQLQFAKKHIDEALDMLEK